jgi:hypothetical protein
MNDEAEIPEEDIEAARMIREVKTIRLKPEDRLAIVVKSEEINRSSLDGLRKAMLRWLGEKNSNRVVVLVGDIELTKVRKEDDECSDQERTNRSESS